MRKRVLTFMLALGVFFIADVVSAQDYSGPEYEKWGDVNERKDNIINYNYFMDAIKSKDYDKAQSYLGTLLKKCPKAGENLYRGGAAVYKNRIAKAQTKEEKLLYVDSLMYLYDVRADHFADGQNSGLDYILNQKARDFMTYVPQDKQKMVALVHDAIEESGSKADLDLVKAYFNILVDAYLKDEVETELILSEYDYITNIISSNDLPDKTTSQSIIDQLFVKSGVANCENLEKMFKAQLASNPDDAEIMAKAMGYLAKANCTSEFQTSLAEKFHAIEPTSASAIVLAMSFEEKKDYEKAFKYFDEAIALEQEDGIKSTYAARAAGVSLVGKNDSRAAAEYAKKAIALNGNNGLAYFFLAQSYSLGAGSACSDIDRGAVYWLVTDLLVKARGLLESDPNQVEKVNDSIKSAASRYPDSEALFYNGIQKGSAYTVKCGWITGNTTVK